jgi:hypothetical protein
MINNDMLASPNYVMQVHNSASAPAGARKGSEAIEQRFAQSFEGSDLPFTLVPMVSGSDFVPYVRLCSRMVCASGDLFLTVFFLLIITVQFFEW